MLTGSQVLPTDMLGDITSSSKWVGEPDYVDGRCPEVSGVLVPSRCSLDFTPVTSTVASPNPPSTISKASSVTCTSTSTFLPDPMQKYFLRKTFGGFGGYPPLFWKKIRQTVFETLPIIPSKMRKRKEETSMI